MLQILRADFPYVITRPSTAPAIKDPAGIERINTLKSDRMDELALHPTVKTVQMIADAIKDVSGRGGIVLDLFCGSGSTIIAAHKTGRRAYVCEIDPVYCDRSITSWERHAKYEAILIACGWPRSLEPETLQSDQLSNRPIQPKRESGRTHIKRTERESGKAGS